jgi:hypothetical protein
MKYSRILSFIFLALVTSQVKAQTDTWTNGGNDASYSDTANWSTGAVPTSTSNVQIGAQPTANIIGIDTGSNVTVASFTFNSSLTASVQVVPNTTEQLSVNGAITDSSSYQDQFAITVNAGANATYTGGSAGLQFSLLNINTQNILTVNSVAVASSGTLVFDINSLSSYGTVGSLAVSGATINVLGSYTGHAGDSFDLTTGNFSGATLGTLPTLSAGLQWNTSNFISQGLLTVQAVPEPSTFALFALGLCLVAGSFTFRYAGRPVRS